MAEALQQEVIGDDIHVSLIFPPDTETPGFAEGLKSNFISTLFMSCMIYSAHHVFLCTHFYHLANIFGGIQTLRNSSLALKSMLC